MGERARETRHTPGPWQMERTNWKGEPAGHRIYISGDPREDWGDDDDDEVGRHDEPVICSTAVAIVEGNATSGGVTDANARLIAAAPDLLAALQSFGVLSCTPEWDERRRAALAKAAGSGVPRA